MLLLVPVSVYWILAGLMAYIILVCSYTCLASWFIISETGVSTATPSWRYRWLIHLNLLFPSIALKLSSSDAWIFTTFSVSSITNVHVIGFKDKTCKVLLDIKDGVYELTATTIMDQFSHEDPIKSALTRLTKKPEQFSVDEESSPSLGVDFDESSIPLEP